VRLRTVQVAIILGGLALSTPSMAQDIASIPEWTLQLDPLTTALGFVHLQVEKRLSDSFSVYAGPHLHLFDGLLDKESGESYRGYGVEAGLRWFFLGGGWLEEFVFATVQERPVTDARMNVKLDWERNQTAPKRAEQQIRNEFDVLFTSGNRLHVISCKTGNLDAPTEAGGNKGKEAIYELEALADKAGGPFGRAMLVSARRLSDYSRSRASRMKIEVVDGVDVLGLGKRLERWRQGA